MEKNVLKSRKMSKFAAVLTAVSIGISGVMTSGCTAPRHDETDKEEFILRGGLFSWGHDVVEIEKGKSENPMSDKLFQTMGDLQLETLYQSFSEKLSMEDIRVFLKKAEEKDIDVFMLTGEPDWAEEDTEKHITDELKRADKINRKLDGEAEIEGIMLDIEPYLTEKWEDSREEMMTEYAAALAEAYKTAEKLNLQMIVCVPFFYDTKGFGNELESIAANGCDGIAVMNYYKGKEIEHIETELRLAQKYGKYVINIYEFNRPDTYGVTENNTYHEEGTGAALRNFRELVEFYCMEENGENQEVFPAENISFAFHDFRALTRDNEQ